MDDDKIEPYEIKRPLLGTAVGRGWLTLWAAVSASWKTEWTPFWEKIILGVQRHYLKPVYLLAFILTPFWLWLIAEIVINLFIQLANDIPEEHNDKRAHFYAIGLTITGLGAVLAAPFVLIKAWVNERQARTSEQGHITDRITKAVEQLGAEKAVKRQRLDADGHPVFQLDAKNEPDPARPFYDETTEPNIEVRLGAIYALERIAQDSERDHIPIMETLCAYVRHNSNERIPENFEEPTPKNSINEDAWETEFERVSLLRSWAHSLRLPREDVQAALTVIGRREPKRFMHEKRKNYKVDLRTANLQRCDMSGSNLVDALFQNVRMEGADLSRAKLDGAKLINACLDGAFLEEAKMVRADMRGIKLSGANLKKSQMNGASLRSARLRGAVLDQSILDGASLDWAQLQNANLRETQLVGTNFTGANLSRAQVAKANAQAADFTKTRNMTQEQVNSLFGDDDTKLPAAGKDGKPLMRTFLEG